MKPEITFDPEADVYYIQLSSNKIYKTSRITSNILVDVDEEGYLVGIESLSLGAKIPFDKLKFDYALTEEQASEIKSVMGKLYRG